ncbi:DEAD/DEAH box helicase [Myroides sp. LJL119]
MNFKDFTLCPSLLDSIHAIGYKTPTAIQQQAIPAILAKHDVLGWAQTGTGKTAAFAIPILELVARTTSKSSAIQALVVVPTRELALQVEKTFVDINADKHIKIISIFGGVSQVAQVKNLKKSPQILIATPGRLLDLIQQKLLSISQIKQLVLDEADQMLDMGFVHDIKKILRLTPRDKQTLFFSATMPQNIEEFANTILVKPTRIQVKSQSLTADKIQQFVYFSEQDKKKNLLKQIILDNPNTQILVFTRTKHGANNLVKFLQKSNITSAAIHGNKSQGARVKALEEFKNKTNKILIATDIAARGIDIDKLPLVVNYEIPNIPETYVHRIGRTARAGENGQAISMCSTQEKTDLKKIEKLTKVKIKQLKNPLEHTKVN